MVWGIQTWDANGIPNNYGIKPVSVVGTVPLAEGQASGAWSFPVPAGFKLGYVVSLDNGGTKVGRQVVISGNTISLSPASEIGPGNYPASACELVVFMERA
ncbi:hypothetical protein R4P48_23300 [Atlantibacter subterranea]|uniref:Uncharacterized protein n=1 Tax=Atlantibacter subterraneus TaxID=255519 RepID=A0ABU4E8W8_9ENTR|nr:hypothetical protein [Atlantibacter subterranea]MDV7025570.1 hypothetical protein [Atlantibacter subterranea]QFH70946.1 hypothetical protein FR762_15000 [Enterobacter sp. E76]